MDEQVKVDWKSAGKRIKAFRVKKDMTQEEISEGIGVSLNFYGMVERGEKGMSLNKLVHLSEILDFSIDYVIKGDFKVNENIPLVDKINEIDKWNMKYAEEIIRIFVEATKNKPE